MRHIPFGYMRNLDDEIPVPSNFGTGFNDEIYDIYFDGTTMMAAGAYTTYNSGDARRIVRLYEDGTKDTSFTYGDAYNGSTFFVTGFTGSTYMICGNFTTYTNPPAVPGPSVINYYAAGVSQIESDGDAFLDTGGFPYIPDAWTANGYTTQFGLQSTGKPIFVGTFVDWPFCVGGGCTSVVNRIVRLNDVSSNFFYDTGFKGNTGTGFNNTVKTMVILPDDTILLGGDFTTFNGGAVGYIVKLNSDGSYNSTFGSGFNGAVEKITTDSSGNIYVGGAFTSYNGSSCSKIVKLNSGGSIDSSFNIGSGFNNTVYSISINPTNTKIAVGGAFTSYNGITSNGIIILNSNGSKNTIFNSRFTTFNSVRVIKWGSFGKSLIVGGDFTSYDSITTNNILRLRTSGTLL